jgi:hypothetical protein
MPSVRALLVMPSYPHMSAWHGGPVRGRGLCRLRLALEQTLELGWKRGGTTVLSVPLPR